MGIYERDWMKGGAPEKKPPPETEQWTIPKREKATPTRPKENGLKKTPARRTKERTKIALYAGFWLGVIALGTVAARMLKGY